VWGWVVDIGTTNTAQVKRETAHPIRDLVATVPVDAYEGYHTRSRTSRARSACAGCGSWSPDSPIAWRLRSA
jgi:hypothetical protein